MLRICRAEDGEEFRADVSLRDIERTSTLERFVWENAGVDQDAVLAYLSDGRRLTNDNLRDLAGAPDNTIFVFNKYYLDYDTHEVLRELRIQPPLQSVVEDAISSTPPFRPSELARACLRVAHLHYDDVAHLAGTVRLQLEALGIASRSLDLNILSLSEGYDPFAQGTRTTLEKQASLLADLDLDLAAVAAIRVHTDFLSPSVRKGIESGDRPRTLGDYVSYDKMRQVASGCGESYAALKNKFEEAEETMTRLIEGANQIRSILQKTRALDNAASTEKKAHDTLERISAIAVQLEGLSNVEGAANLVQEIKQADNTLRKEVESITDIKNLSTEFCISTLRHISALNSDLVQLPDSMTSIHTELRKKTNFSHIERLHNMLYAYGATLIEIVRRKEFTHFFYQRAQTILEVMARATSAERKRRQIYRGEVHGQLPFNTTGLDESVPEIDFTPSGGRDVQYTIERSDVEAFLGMLAAFEQELQDQSGTGTTSLQITRNALEKLVEKMDSIELSFDKFVERSLLSSSRLSLSRRRLTDADEAAFRDLVDKVSALEGENKRLVNDAASEKQRYEKDISTLRAQLERQSASEDHSRDRYEALEREIHSLKAQNEADVHARRILEQRHEENLHDIETLRKGQADALAEATRQAQEAESLRLELSRAREEYEEVKQMESRHSARISQLLADQTKTLRSLEEARLRGDDLKVQIEAARLENSEANRALREASDQKEQLLRAQALEHDRIMRDHIAEADGDRAVLEKQFSEARAQLEQNERQFKEAQSKTEVLNADVAGLKEELQRTEHELREARHNERVLRNDLSEGRASKSLYEQTIAERDRLVAQILDAAIAFRESHIKTFAILQPISIHPSAAIRGGSNPSESVALSPPRLPSSPLREVATPIDPQDPPGALEILRSYDLDVFSETVGKVASVIRKWQKQCREYRERAKGKITFRNFAKGDLALFLPTRNSATKPWAAFNVSFPHYFLNATGRLAEQLKTREWIVARIVSIAERVASTEDPASNPYGLSNGVRYYVLEVEDWTRPGSESSKRRKSTTSRTVTDDRATSPTPIERPISPPPAEAQQSGASAAEPLGATRSPNSHLFPVRARSNSTSAGPSSLSRLLAQAPTPVETPHEAVLAFQPPRTRTRTPSPVSKVSIPNPPSPTRVSQAHSPVFSSPLRPGSRASRTSSSRVSFSGGRLAPFPRTSATTSVAPTKASPTTALTSDHTVDSSPSSPILSKRDSISHDVTADTSLTPSPTQSATEGMVHLFTRRRTASEHIAPLPSTQPRPDEVGVGGTKAGSTAAGALANLANTFGMSMTLGRRKKATATPRPERTATNVVPSSPTDTRSPRHVSGIGAPSSPASGASASTSY